MTGGRENAINAQPQRPPGASAGEDGARPWEALRASRKLPIAECAHCGIEFIQRRTDHRFCCPEHRKLGERKPYDPPPADPEQVRRLFDEDRDPDERVRDDDWHGNRDDENGQAWMELDATDTVGQRREWYRTLVDWRGAA